VRKQQNFLKGKAILFVSRQNPTPFLMALVNSVDFNYFLDPKVLLQHPFLNNCTNDNLFNVFCVLHDSTFGSKHCAVS
jgi:hypothetical protein